MRSLPVPEPAALLFLQLTAVQGGSPAWLYSRELNTEPFGLAPNDPAVKHRDISISVGDETCQQKADGKMKGIGKERLSDSLTFIRLTKDGGTPTRGVPLWGFLCNFTLQCTFNSLPLCAQLSVCLSLSFFLLVSAWMSQSARLSAPVSVCLSTWFCHSAVPSTHLLFVNLQPCRQLLSPLMMLTSTLRPRLMTRSTVASRGPRSSWRSGTATAWRGWVVWASQDTTSYV